MFCNENGLTDTVEQTLLNFTKTRKGAIMGFYDGKSDFEIDDPTMGMSGCR